MNQVMKILIIILLAIVAVIALFLIVALFLKKKYTIEREIVILKPKQVVFDYIRLLKNQDSFSKWANIDPGMKKDYTGTDGTVGFISAWDSANKQVGKGEQTIKKITEGDSIDYELHFIKPFENRSAARMATKSIADNQTRVIWSFSSKMNWPMNLMLVFMNMEKMLGDDLQTGLQNLKSLLEK
jgi:hypothetical protein